MIARMFDMEDAIRPFFDTVCAMVGAGLGIVLVGIVVATVLRRRARDDARD
jgi:hypothetical protein